MPSVNDLTHQAGFVFEATVEQLDASAAPDFPASAETAILEVTSVLKSPPIFAQFAGQRITIKLQPPVTAKVGDTHVFFTHGIHYGEGVVVEEIGHATSETAVHAQVASATQVAADSALTQRLAEADSVITGTASAPRAYTPAAAAANAAGTPRILRVSEHDPDWGVSTIAVESTEKGAAPGATKDVIFPRSMDIAWYKAPKIKEGDHGTWLLHRRDPYGKPVPADAVVHPLDFQPTAQTAHVRALLALATPK